MNRVAQNVEILEKLSSLGGATFLFGCTGRKRMLPFLAKSYTTSWANFINYLGSPLFSCFKNNWGALLAPSEQNATSVTKIFAIS